MILLVLVYTFKWPAVYKTKFLNEDKNHHYLKGRILHSASYPLLLALQNDDYIQITFFCFENNIVVLYFQLLYRAG